MTNRAKSRALIPFPSVTEAEESRLYHRDIAGLRDAEIDAERVFLRIELSKRVFEQQPEAAIDRDLRTGAVTTAEDWLRARLALLGSEHVRRRGARA